MQHLPLSILHFLLVSSARGRRGLIGAWLAKVSCPALQHITSSVMSKIKSSQIVYVCLGQLVLLASHLSVGRARQFRNGKAWCSQKGQVLVTRNYIRPISDLLLTRFIIRNRQNSNLSLAFLLSFYYLPLPTWPLADKGGVRCQVFTRINGPEVKQLHNGNLF